MAGNSVAANLLMLLFLVGGFAVMTMVKKEVFPEFSRDTVQVTVAYPGASPEEVEQGIILPVEEAVQGLEDAKEVRSTASEGSGSVTIEAVTGADLSRFTDDVKSEVDRITTFPEEAEEPEVQEMSHRRDVLDLMVYGDVDRTTLHQLGEQTKDRLRNHPDITQVELSGLPDLEIGVKVPRETLRRYGLSLDEIANRVRNRSVDMPGGEIETNSGEILVRMKERRDYGKEFGRINVVSSKYGSEVQLKDLATIEDGFAESDRELRYNGKPAVELEVFRVGDQTPVEVAGAVDDVRQELKKEYPTGIRTSVMDDSSVMYKRRANLMLKNGAIGLVLVLVLLGMFLEIRLAFWVMMGIPISFLGSFFVLPPMGVSINIVSMFAYIIAIGIVIDDAIIVGENVYNYREECDSFLEAAITGTQEVAGPVTFAVLTNIAAFLPLYFLPGIMGKVFSVIPVVVGAAFLISLIECLYILPAHLGHGNENFEPPIVFKRLYRWQQSFSKWFMGMVRSRFGALLKVLIRHRYLSIVVVFSLLIVVFSYPLSGRMGMSLFPQIEDDNVQAELVFPVGTPVSKTKQAAKRIRKAARSVQKELGTEELIEGILVEIGQGGSHNASVRVQLAGPEVRERTVSASGFYRRWKENTGRIPGVDYLTFDASGGPGGGADINVELRHRSIDILERASAHLAKELREYSMVSEINDGFQQGKPQFDLTMKPGADALGLTAQGVGQQLRSAYYGSRAIRQLRGQNEIELLVKLPEKQRDSAYSLSKYKVKTPDGQFVPLKEVAQTELGRSFISIERRQGQRVIQVTADANPRSKSRFVLNDLEESVLPELGRKFPELDYSFEGRHADMRESMGSLKVLFTIAMIGIFALLAVPLQSYIQPFIIMTSVPFGIVGAVVGHLIMGYNLSVISLMGVVALSGVVVNDSLILTTFANRLREQEQFTVKKAIHESAIRRFRQVMLTSLTTFGGLAPLIFETSRQARFIIPMAISLGFGILFTFIIILCFTPLLYIAVDDLRSLLGYKTSS